MNMSEYQRRLETYDVSPGAVWYYGLGLTGEAGEVVELIKKSFRLGKYTKFYTTEEMALELGDVMWYVTRLASVHGFTLEELAQMNIDKLEKRRLKVEGVCPGFGPDRETGGCVKDED